jgi:hyperosmotically inducible protein
MPLTRVVAPLALVAGVLAGCAATPDADRTHQAAADDQITSAIKAKLASDSEVSSGAEIRVETTRGVVALSGFATTRAEEREAVGVARTVQGVRGVDDLITVKTTNN